MSTVCVRHVRARAVQAPLEYTLRSSIGVIATVPLVLIDIETDTGVTGRSYVFAYTPVALKAVQSLVEELGATLVGKPVAPVTLDAELELRLRLLGRGGLVIMACSGLDMALCGALAIHQDVPLAVLLGGAPRPIPAYDSHGLDGVELGPLRARKAVDAGFRAIKTKMGYPTLSQDLEVLRAIRQAVGSDVQIMVDFNQGLSVPEAELRIRALAQEGVAWVEEPTIQENLDGHARLRGLGVPIQLGENWCGPAEMQRAVQVGACDLAMPDVMKIGGVTGWLRAAALAQVAGIPMSSHIFPEISAHLLAVTPTAHWLERMDLAGPILAQPVRYVDGCAVSADVPGSGVSWNEEAVRAYSVN